MRQCPGRNRAVPGGFVTDDRQHTEQFPNALTAGCKPGRWRIAGL